MNQVLFRFNYKSESAKHFTKVRCVMYRFDILNCVEGSYKQFIHQNMGQK